MKKICLIAAALTALVASAAADEVHAGDTVYLGAYEQDNNAEDGAEAIAWTVLDVQEGKALLAADRVLDCQPYNDRKTDMTWENSTLRAWLQDVFYETAFTDAEKTAVLPVKNGNDQGNISWTTTGGNETEDRVFLPSCAEVAKYFPAQNDRKLTGSEYARSNGAKLLGMTTLVVGETDWWLRSPGKVQTDAAYIGVKGDIGTKQVSDKLGVRPMIWMDTAADQSAFPYTVFKSADALKAAGNYTEAADVFNGLGTYNGSESAAKDCLYQQAAILSEAGDNDGAISLYETLGDYMDSYALCRRERYAKAVAAQEAGDYAEAAKLFGGVGQYEDSMARMKACFDKQGINVYYFGAEAMNTGKDNGYSKPAAINGKDRHFGWRLGRFFMSGFTRKTEDKADNPVFIKTLGDSITLWFDLEQDIDALDGNKQLIIGEDSNGYDQTMSVKKMNFGRGTLIIRHTDYQNEKSDPVIYTDYLLAKGTTAADTKVILAEEGDYEAVLDYEIQDNDVKHVLDKFGNYQIAFRFSVRNGNCMVYPFDIATGAELQNTSITEDGFYLDLARSRYLDIDVKRTELVETAAGIVEDERFNRPAKDGDRYTAEGIYTISVSNKYTGEKTTKTIFVGSDELLQQYISKGFSVDRLK